MDKIIHTTMRELHAKHKAGHEPYEYVKYEVTPREKTSQAYVAFYELPPQKANYPYHYHVMNTEVFYIISGQGRLETPEGTRRVQPGDIIVCPPSACGAHKLVNTSYTEMLRYLDVDTAQSPDVVKYPDSGKTGVNVHGASSTIYQDADAVDYYTGE